VIPRWRFASIDSRMAAIGGTPRIDALAIQNSLYEGSTVVMEAVDDLMPGIRNLSNEIRRVFNADCQVNAYLVTGNTGGFDLHWDDHDALVLQVCGTKRWFVYEPTIANPVRGIVNLLTPSGHPPVIFDVNPGDVLYLPRGWWHRAEPSGEPTIHLTFSVQHYLGADYMFWVFEQLRSAEPFRTNLPLDSSGKQSMRFHAADHGETSLPVAGQSRHRIADEDDISLASATPIVLFASDAEHRRRLFLHAKEWDIDEAIEGLLRLLATKKSISFASATDAAPQVSREELEGVIEFGRRNGLFEIENKSCLRVQ
jgi:hypothetical protein